MNTEMYAKIAFKEMIGDGLHGGEPVNLPFSIPACEDSGRDEKLYFHQSEVGIHSVPD